MKKAISKAALAVGAAVTSGAVAFNCTDPGDAGMAILAVAMLFGFLSLAAEVLG
jgi:hypothetical protein